MSAFTIIFNQIKELKAKKYAEDWIEIQARTKAKREIEEMLKKDNK